MIRLLMIGTTCWNMLYPGGKWLCSLDNEPGTDIETAAIRCEGGILYSPKSSGYSFLSAQCPVATTDAVISWLLPTTNADGTPLTDLAGVKVYFNGVLFEELPPVTQYTLAGLTGKHSIHVTAFDTSGNESSVDSLVAVIQ